MVKSKSTYSLVHIVSTIELDFKIILDMTYGWKICTIYNAHCTRVLAENNKLKVKNGKIYLPNKAKVRQPTKEPRRYAVDEPQPEDNFWKGEDKAK